MTNYSINPLKSPHAQEPPLLPPPCVDEPLTGSPTPGGASDDALGDPTRSAPSLRYRPCGVLGVMDLIVSVLAGLPFVIASAQLKISGYSSPVVYGLLVFGMFLSPFLMVLFFVRSRRLTD